MSRTPGPVLELEDNRRVDGGQVHCRVVLLNDPDATFVVKLPGQGVNEVGPP